MVPDVKFTAKIGSHTLKNKICQKINLTIANKIQSFSILTKFKPITAYALAILFLSFMEERYPRILKQSFRKEANMEVGLRFVSVAEA